MHFEPRVARKRCHARTRRWMAVGLAVATVVGCQTPDGGGAPTKCSAVAWPTVPNAKGKVYYVSQACGSANATGTKDQPFDGLGAAAKLAQPGTTVVVAAGQYVTDFMVPGGVAVVGAGAGSVTFLPPIGAVSRLVFKGPGTNALRGVTVQAGQAVALVVEGGDLDMSDVTVSGATTTDPKLHNAHGVQVSGAAKLQLQSCRISDNDGVGLLVAGKTEVVVTDPAAPSPRPQPDSKDPAALAASWATASQITGNQGGGIALTGGASLTLTGTAIENCGNFGVGVWAGGQVSIDCTVIRDIHKLNGDSSEAVGIYGEEGQTTGAIVARDTVLTQCQRSCILVNGPATVTLDGVVSHAGYGGVAAQGKAAKLTVGSKAWVAENGLFGIRVSSGASAIVEGARLEKTLPVKWVSPRGGVPQDIGDAVFASSGAHVTVGAGTVIKESYRAGVFFCGADTAASSITGVQFSGAKIGIAVTAGSPPLGSNSGNMFEGVAQSLALDVSPGCQ